MSPNKARWKNKRIKTPTILQMQPTECGAACLAMVFAHYGLYKTLDILRGECGVSRDGSKAENLIKVAEKYGFNAHIHQNDVSALKQIALPMILFWNGNHFVVLEGIKGKQAYINDPNSGPKKIAVAELKESYSNQALSFEPGPDFKKAGQKPNIYRSLAKRFDSCWLALLFIVLTGVLMIVPGVVNPTYVTVFLDDILALQFLDWFRPLLLAMALTALTILVLSWMQQLYLVRFQLKLSLKESARFFHHVFRLPVDYFAQRFSGDIAGRVGLNDNLAQLLSGQLSVTIIQMLTVAVYAIFLFQYSIVLTVIGIAFALLNLLVLRLASYTRTNLSMASNQEYGKLMGLTMSGIQMIDTIKACGSESEYFAKWTGHQAKYLNAEQRLNLSTRLLSVLPATLTQLNQVFMLFVGAYLIMNGNLTIGMLFAFQGLMSGFMQPFSNFVDMGSSLQEAHSYLNRLDDVVANPLDVTFARPALPAKVHPPPPCPDKLTGKLELKNVTFGYSTLAAPLIENFNLLLLPGSRVALVGSSGSGKSTIGNLVAGLYNPWQGEVLFDDCPIHDIDRRIFTNSVAMVNQNIFIFGGSIHENLTMWDTTIDERDVIQAARDASIHDVIVARDGAGYQAAISEGGSNFSGGQCQRIEIARALAGNPNLIILDEATSALDANTEKEIDDNLRRRGCTCLIVAHRLSTIRDCDEIIVLDRGKVVQRGIHEDLRNQGGLYAELIKDE